MLALTFRSPFTLPRLRVSRQARRLALRPNVKCGGENYVAHEVKIRTVPVSIAYRPIKTVAFEFVDSALHAKHICLARRSPLPLEGRGQGEGSARSHVTAGKCPHLHPLPFTEKGEAK